jgi:XapX domain-containing protein
MFQSPSPDLSSLSQAHRQGGNTMKLYLFSLLAGVLVGVIYSLINVRSPAPPLVALVGLLGILGGEQIIPVAKQMLSGAGFHTAWNESKCNQHMFGSLPGRQSTGTTLAGTAKSPEKHS